MLYVIALPDMKARQQREDILTVLLSKEKRGFVAGTTAVTDELTRHASDVGLFRAGQSGTSQMSDDAKGIGLSESKVVLCAPFVLTSAWVEAALSAAPLLSSVSRK